MASALTLTWTVFDSSSPSAYRDRELGRIRPGRRVGVRRRALGRGRAAVAEVPHVGDAARAAEREADLARRAGRRPLRVGVRGVRAAGVGEPVQAGLRAGGEEARVDLHVERAVGPELGVHVVGLPVQDAPEAVGVDRLAAVLVGGRVEQQAVLGAVVAEVLQEPAAVPVLGPARRVVLGVVVIAVDGAVEHRRAGGREVRAQLRRVRPVVGRAVRAELALEVRAAVGAARVAAAVPEVQRPRAAGVLPRAGLVRQHGEAGVVRRVVDEVVAVVPALRRAGGRAAADEAGGVGGAQRAVRDAVAVGLLVAHAVGPAVVAGLGELGGALVGRRAERLGRLAGVRADPRRVRDVGLGIDEQARRVAQAHRVDLRLGLAAVALGAVEQVRAVGRVRVRQRVRAVDADRGLRPVGDRVDGVEAQHLAVVIVGAAGCAPRVAERDVVAAAVVVGGDRRVTGRAARGLVVARGAVRALRRVRVAGGDVEVALGVEAHAAAAVAAAVDLRVVLEDHDLGVELELLGGEVDGEAADARLGHLRDAPLVAVREARVDRVLRVEGREVLQVDVPGRGEVGRDRDAEQAGLDLAVDLVSAAAIAVDGQDAGLRDAAVDGPVGGRGVPDVDVAAADADVAVGEVEDAAGRPGADHLPALRVGAAVGAADVEDPAVGRGGDAVRLAGMRHVAGRAVDQALAAVVGGDGRLAAGADHAGAPLDRAEQVGAEVGLVVAGRGAAHAGVEGAAALEVAAPRDRPVGAADVGAVAGRRVRARGSGRRCGPGRWAGSATRTRRPDGSTRAGGPRRRVHAVADLDDLLGRARSGCPLRDGRRSGCRRRCCRARPRRRRRCRRSRRRR